MNVASIIASSASAVVVLGAASHVIRRAYRWFQGIGAAVKLAASRTAQLEPNGGSSVKDAISRIENYTLPEIKAHLERQDAELARLREEATHPAGRRRGSWQGRH